MGVRQRIDAWYAVVAVTLRVHGAERAVAVDPQTPLLYVLRNDLGMKGVRFGLITRVR